MKRILGYLFLAAICSGCASMRSSSGVLIGVGGGAIVGSVGGAAFSPNGASRPWNALIFGLSGALIGGTMGYLTRSKANASEAAEMSLRSREQAAASTSPFAVMPPLKEPLPGFLKDRLTGLVIEELSMPSRVGEDGTLHEPHKAYRIKRNPQLLPVPGVQK